MHNVMYNLNVRDRKARVHDTLNEGKSDMAALKEWAEEREITLLGRLFQSLHDDTKMSIEKQWFWQKAQKQTVSYGYIG